jgi:hypothetical protein
MSPSQDSDDVYPPWVYDLITAVQEWENIHTAVSPHDTSSDRRTTACFKTELDAVPPLVRRAAKVIWAYKRQVVFEARQTDLEE